MNALLRVVVCVSLAAACLLGCDSNKSDADGPKDGPKAVETASSPTNRVDIPETVRQNLGISFAKVESRAVANTLRVPGSFELLPTARREYRTPLGGRVELLVRQYERVAAGAPLYRLDSAAWRGLHEQIASTQAKADSMAPIRNAHRAHEKSLADKVQLWKDRLARLEELRAAGGGTATQFTEARAALNQTQAELADVMEKDAELESQRKIAEAELRALQSRRESLVRAGGGAGVAGMEDGFVVHATAPGAVESIAITNGGLAEESGMILAIVQPEQIRFRARGLQADLRRLRDDLAASVVPPSGNEAMLGAMRGKLQLGLTADADERTVDLLMTPQTLAPWARAGIAAHLEITLEGGEAELAVPASAITRDGARPIIFRRDPKDPDKAIRMEADVGLSDGRWVVIKSGVKEGDEIVLDGVYQLMLATAGNVSKGGHFHPDGTFHDGEDK